MHAENFFDHREVWIANIEAARSLIHGRRQFLLGKNTSTSSGNIDVLLTNLAVKDRPLIHFAMHPSSFLAMSNSPWSPPKDLALDGTSRIYIMSAIQHNLLRYTQSWTVPFHLFFNLWISGIVLWLLLFSESQKFPDFLELFPGNFHTICSRRKNFGIFAWMESAHWLAK